MLLLGPPGTGKGTQTRRLSEYFGWPRVASGELLRAAALADTPDGQEARRYMEGGRLVPDALVEQFVLRRISAPDCRDGAVLDGFPRTVAQAAALDRDLAARGTRVSLALLLDVEGAELTRRLAGRLTCRACGATHHPRLNPPRREGACDLCGGALYVRDDDQADVVQARHTVFEQQTLPLLAYYAEDGRLRREDGTGRIADVWGRVLRAIGSVGSPAVAAAEQGGAQ